MCPAGSAPSSFRQPLSALLGGQAGYKIHGSRKVSAPCFQNDGVGGDLLLLLSPMDSVSRAGVQQGRAVCRASAAAVVHGSQVGLRHKLSLDSSSA